MTREPGPVPDAINGRSSASLPEAQDTAYLVPQYSASRYSGDELRT